MGSSDYFSSLDQIVFPWFPNSCLGTSSRNSVSDHRLVRTIIETEFRQRPFPNRSLGTRKLNANLARYLLIGFAEGINRFLISLHLVMAVLGIRQKIWLTPVLCA